MNNLSAAATALKSLDSRREMKAILATHDRMAVSRLIAGLKVRLIDRMQGAGLDYDSATDAGDRFVAKIAATWETLHGRGEGT